VDTQVIPVGVERAPTKGQSANCQTETLDPGCLLDFDSAAAFLSTSPRHVRRLWQERRIAAIKVGKAVRFRRADLLAYIERHRVEAVR